MIILGSDEDDDSYDFISKMAFTHAMPKERLTTSPLGLTCHCSSNSIWIVGMIKMLKLIADLIKLETNVFFQEITLNFVFITKKTYISIINLQITIQRWGLFEHEKCWLSKKQSGKKFCFNSFEEWVIEEKRESYTFCYPAIV